MPGHPRLSWPSKDADARHRRQAYAVRARQNALAGHDKPGGKRVDYPKIPAVFGAGMPGLFSRRDAWLQRGGLAAASLVPAASVPGVAAPLRQPVQGIDAALQAKVGAREIPGVVAMAANESAVVYQGAFGFRNMAVASRMSSDTVFRIASMVKLLTSVAALQLGEQVKLLLDDPAANIDPTLASPQLLAGFDPKGIPQLRPPQKPIT